MNKFMMVRVEDTGSKTYFEDSTADTHKSCILKYLMNNILVTHFTEEELQQAIINEYMNAPSINIETLTVEETA